MYEGLYCETRLDASGSFSFLMFVFMIGLVIAGILILWQRDKFRDEIREYQERIRNSANSLGSKNNQPNKFNNADGRPISPRQLAAIEQNYIDDPNNGNF